MRIIAWETVSQEALRALIWRGRGKVQYLYMLLAKEYVQSEFILVEGYLIVMRNRYLSDFRASLCLGKWRCKNLHSYFFVQRYFYVTKGLVLPKHRMLHSCFCHEFLLRHCWSVTLVANDLIFVELRGEQHSLLYS